MQLKKKFPDTLAIIMAISLLFLLLTWLVPAGEFDREVVNGTEVVVAGSYREVAPQPQGLGALFMTPIKGLVSAASVIAFIFLVGGAFSILNGTGAINSGIAHIIRLSENRPQYKIWILPCVTALFSLAGATFGMSEEILVFVLITIPLSQALGYDAIVGAAIPVIGTGVGFAGAITNPFTIGIAQSIAEVPLFSGMFYRSIVWAVLTLVAALAIQRYALRIYRDPSKSLVYGLKSVQENELHGEALPQLNSRRKLILYALGLTIALLIYGVTSLGWYINEIAALFLALGVLSALIYRMDINTAIRHFTEGARDMMTAALVIGLSKGLLILAQDGKIIDTLLNAVAVMAGEAPRLLSAELMLVFQCCLNFFIPSGSGQAALTMPIMAPLSDLLGVSRQVAVLAFQMGDGLTNMIVPTSGVTMGVLSIAGIPYDRWFRFTWPVLLVLVLCSMVLLALPVSFFTW